MYQREVKCGVPECEQAASFKIAAPWRVGRFQEMKSYGLACGEHVSLAYREALERAKAHPLSPEESVGEIGIYAYERGKHDRELTRRKELEAGA